MTIIKQKVEQKYALHTMIEGSILFEEARSKRLDSYLTSNYMVCVCVCVSRINVIKCVNLCHSN